jgi:hypothetical protein
MVMVVVEKEEERRALLKEEAEEEALAPFAARLVCAIEQHAMLLLLPLPCAEEIKCRCGGYHHYHHCHSDALMRFARARAERLARAYEALGWDTTNNNNYEGEEEEVVLRELVGRAAEQAEELAERVEARVEALARLLLPLPATPSAGLLFSLLEEDTTGPGKRRRQFDVAALERHRQAATSAEWTPRNEQAYAELLLTRLPDVVLPRFLLGGGGIDATPAHAAALRATAEALWALRLRLRLRL